LAIGGITQVDGILNRSAWRDDAIQGMIQATSTDELLIQNKNAVNPFERGDPV